MSLLEHVLGRAAAARIPLSVHVDLTYRCNERCVHCYLDHDDHGEMTTAEVTGVLDQLAEAGALFLTLSGGEVLLRRDFFDILAHARGLGFDAKVKTNGLLLGEREARRLRALGVRQVQISVYSHRASVHDAITRVPGSLERSVAAMRFLKAQGLRVLVANVLMQHNADDYAGVQALARDIGVEFTLDPTITPKMDGDTSIVSLRVPRTHLLRVFTDPSLVGEDFCGTPPPPDDAALDAAPCSAGHTACYVSPYGDVFPCVQFPLPSGNVRRQRFAEIWRDSPQLNDVRSIRMRDLPTCSTCSLMAGCTRCPGLAYMEGNMRGPSSADCEKALVRASAVPPASPGRGVA